MVTVTVDPLTDEQMEEERKSRAGRGRSLAKHMEERFLSPASIQKASEDRPPAPTGSRPPAALSSPEEGASSIPNCSPLAAQCQTQGSCADTHPLSENLDGQLVTTRTVNVGSPERVISAASMGTMIEGAPVISTLLQADAAGRSDFGRVQVRCTPHEAELLRRICDEKRYKDEFAKLRHTVKNATIESVVEEGVSHLGETFARLLKQYEGKEGNWPVSHGRHYVMNCPAEVVAMDDVKSANPVYGPSTTWQTLQALNKWRKAKATLDALEASEWSPLRARREDVQKRAKMEAIKDVWMSAHRFVDDAESAIWMMVEWGSRRSSTSPEQATRLRALLQDHQKKHDLWKDEAEFAWVLVTFCGHLSDNWHLLVEDMRNIVITTQVAVREVLGQRWEDGEEEVKILEDEVTAFRLLRQKCVEFVATRRC